MEKVYKLVICFMLTLFLTAIFVVDVRGHEISEYALDDYRFFKSCNESEFIISSEKSCILQY